MILDLVIEAGAERFLPMLDRHIARCGTALRQIAADGGYASGDNLDQARARGVRDVAFHKKRGLVVADMAKSAWVYRELRTFRAGIAAGISCLKRAYGGGRCTPAFVFCPGRLARYHAERDADLYTFVADYNRTRLRCLGATLASAQSQSGGAFRLGRLDPAIHEPTTTGGAGSRGCPAQGGGRRPRLY